MPPEPLDSQPVSISGAIALQQPVSLEFVQIVAELVQPIVFGREMEGGEDGLVYLFCGPTTHGVTAMEKNLK